LPILAISVEPARDQKAGTGTGIYCGNQQLRVDVLALGLQSRA
jgi:hypothetical protein